MEKRWIWPFELLDKLGEGGMGVVYRARYVVDNRHVAVKLLPPDIGNEMILVQQSVQRRDLGTATTGVRFTETLGTSVAAAVSRIPGVSTVTSVYKGQFELRGKLSSLDAVTPAGLRNTVHLVRARDALDWAALFTPLQTAEFNANPPVLWAY